MTLFLIRHKQGGFSLIEVLMVIALMAVLSTVSISLLTSSVDETRFQETTAKMQQIRNGMIGNPEVRETRTRTSFGFLGDLGAIPTAAQGILGLLTNPTLPAFTVNATVRFGLGWNGPYLSGGPGTDFTKDAWGRAFIYSPAAVPPTLVSYGADGVAGGTQFNQDITVSLPVELVRASVSGFVCKSGGPFAQSAQVELNYPDGSGALVQSLVSLVPADKGYFTYANIPYGVRSLSVYVPSKAAPTQTLGPVVLALDHPNFIVPCPLIDLAP